MRTMALVAIAVATGLLMVSMTLATPVAAGPGGDFGVCPRPQGVDAHCPLMGVAYDVLMYVSCIWNWGVLNCV